MPSGHKAGLTLFELLIVIVIIAAVMAISIPMLLEGRSAANESSAIHSMRAIFNAQQQYYCVNKEYTDLTTLVDKKYLGDRGIAEGYKSGYRFTHELDDPPYHWHAFGTPYNYGTSGRRCFYLDDGGVLFAKDTGSNQLVTPWEAKKWPQVH
jgi:prepilin-type N-terminal cleavage/methylation domain-containing protein